jgi:hypothetical protein
MVGSYCPFQLYSYLRLSLLSPIEVLHIPCKRVPEGSVGET